MAKPAEARRAQAGGSEFSELELVLDEMLSDIRKYRSLYKSERYEKVFEMIKEDT